MAYNTACGDRPPCVALIVDDPAYDAGLNEAIVADLARPVQNASDEFDNKVVGIQIVYGNVSQAVVQAEEKDKPLLVYSWVPRAEIMKPRRFVRITLETFYNCKADLKSGLESDLESSSLAQVHRRGVSACDFPIEQVEKAESWRMQEPKSTAASLFVKSFKLNPTQLHDLLEIGDGGWKESSKASAAELEEIACLWLNQNTEAWGSWMKDVAQEDKTLALWTMWLSVCGLCFFVVFCGFQILSLIKCCPKPATVKEQSEKNVATLTSGKLEYDSVARADNDRQCCLGYVFGKSKTLFGESTMRVRKPEEGGETQVKLVIETKVTHLFNYLRWCLFKTGGFQAPLCFALGQIFKQALIGFVQILLYEKWLEDGLDHLNLQVTISCGVLMLTSKLIIWRVDLLDSGEQKVQKNLQNLLKSQKILSTEVSPAQEPKKDQAEEDEDLKSSHLLLGKYLSTMLSMDSKKDCKDQVKDKYLESSLEDQLEQAIKSTASQLAKDCYLAAHLAFSSFFGFLFAVAFLFYYAFLAGHSDLPQLMIVTFVIAVVWPLIVVAVLAKLKNPARFAIHKILGRKEKLKDKVASVMGMDITGEHTTAWVLRGIMWFCIYLLWAFGPVLLNPLENNYGSGKNSVSQSDLLTDTTYFCTYCSAPPVQVLMVLQTMGESLIELEEHMTTMFTSSSKVTAVVCNTLLDGKIKADEEAPEGEPSPSKGHAKKKLEDASGRSDAEAGEAAADNAEIIKNTTEKAAAEVAEAKSEAAAAVEAAKETAAAAEKRAAAAEKNLAAALTEAAAVSVSVAKERAVAVANAAAEAKRAAETEAEAKAKVLAAKVKAAAEAQTIWARARSWV
eukprot:scaffold87785_cov59-Phaeocystis_antarctica.AAC.1